MGKILIVDDSDLQRRLIADLLKRRFSHTSVEANNATSALALLRKDTAREIFAVLLDLSMPGLDGRDAIPLMHQLRPGLPIIVITGTQSVGDVVAVIKAGAYDYLTKPPNPDLLHNALTKAEQLYALQREVSRLRARDAAGFADLIGGDTAMRACIRLAERAAASDITVMVTGESGVGKEILARAIHAESARQTQPFVAVNCGALPKDLVESILFGHVKGAFTDAVADAAGKFREADGGTLFLDEIGELPLAAQVKLLRALQQREVEPVGGGKPVPVNIRVIAATNRDPARAVANGTFREDLFYRLNVFPIHIPPLRERSGDVVALAEHFLRRYAALENKTLEGFDEAAVAWMKNYGWPGNVRELENRVYRAVLLAETPRIALGDLAPTLPAPMTAAAATVAAESAEASPMLRLALLDESGELKTMERLRDEIEECALRFCEDNVVLAAQKLNVGKSTLYRHRTRERDADTPSD